jgi:hypothetical protein
MTHLAKVGGEGSGCSDYQAASGRCPANARLGFAEYLLAIVEVVGIMWKR